MEAIEIKVKAGFLAVILTASLALTGPGLVAGCSASESRLEPKAAIVDQLSSSEPDQLFTDQTRKALEAHGFKVDYYDGDQVTVDFYRMLPTYGYGLIIFRAHSGLLGDQGNIVDRTALFTNERYSETSHITEQLTDQLAMARINQDYPWVFAIGSKFVNQSMQGKFDHTAIVMMGCSSLYINDLAQSFVDRGASVYLGWDASVGADYVDSVTVDLITKLFNGSVPIGRSLAEVMDERGTDPDFGASLRYYPPAINRLSLGNLLR